MLVKCIGIGPKHKPCGNACKSKMFTVGRCYKAQEDIALGLTLSVFDNYNCERVVGKNGLSFVVDHCCSNLEHNTAFIAQFEIVEA